MAASPKTSLPELIAILETVCIWVPEESNVPLQTASYRLNAGVERASRSFRVGLGKGSRPQLSRPFTRLSNIGSSSRRVGPQAPPTPDTTAREGPSSPSILAERTSRPNTQPSTPVINTNENYIYMAEPRYARQTRHPRQRIGCWIQKGEHGWKIYIPGFKPQWIVLLMGGCMLFAFAIATIGINSAEGRLTVLRRRAGSSFLVAITAGIEAVYTVGVMIAINNGPWAQKRRPWWFFSWLGIVSVSSLLTSIYTFERVRRCREGQLCSRIGDARPHECISGLRSTTAMASLRAAIPGIWVVGMMWFILWSNARKSEERLRRDIEMANIMPTPTS